MLTNMSNDPACQFNLCGLAVTAVVIFMFGLFEGQKLQTERCSINSHKDFNPLEIQEKPKLEESRPVDKLMSFSSQEFACNSQLALEELSILHAKSLKLVAHSKRGDANRDRTATINRKAAAAVASENAFRSCMSTMMPELLKFWDEENNKGHLTTFSEEKEQRIDGITFQVLEQAAIELENSISSQD